MAAPTFTDSTVTSVGRRGDCIIEMAVTAGWSGGGGAGSAPTTGQLWPRGNPLPSSE